MVSGVFDKEDFNVYKKVSDFIKRNSDGEAGAINIFIGEVKKKGRRGGVKALYLEAYKEVANKAIREICYELKKKYSLIDIEIGHGLGEYEVGEPIVYVAIAARSRREMFSAMEEAIEMYKKIPPIFKKEIYEDGSSEWI